MKVPYILQRHRIKKSQSDRRDPIEKEMYERGQTITYEEEGDDDDGLGNNQDASRS